MERSRKKTLEKVDAILTSDWHLREDTPKCRTDDFLQTLIRKMDFVSSLQKKYDCPVIHAGDLFHYWKASPMLISIALLHLPKNFYTIYGQHDLPQHNRDLLSKSAWSTLYHADGIKWIKEGGSWGQEPEEGFTIKNRRIAVLHRLIWKEVRPWPGCTDPSAREILEKYPDYDLIVTGDNHKPFVEKLGNRLLVNPGSLSRQTADQIDHKPRVYLWSAESNSVSLVYIPIEEGVVTREHLESKEERDTRIQAFVERLTHEGIDSELSFEANIERFMDENKLNESVRSIIYRALEKD